MKGINGEKRFPNKYNTFRIEFGKMKRLISIVLFIGLIAFVSSCFKDHSLENTLINKAKGSLQQDAGKNCLPKIIQGIYEAGTVLTASGFISIDIDVTVAGSYIIESNTVNGYLFKSAGVFEQKGIQTIKLVASGKPTIAGTDNFEISFDGSSCLIQVTVFPKGLGGPAVFTLQGAGSSCTNATVVGSYIVSTPLTAANTVSLTVNVIKIGSYNITTTAVNGISFHGTGIFSTTGPHTILLAGSGTPINNNPTNFSVTDGVSTCTFPVTVTGIVTGVWNFTQGATTTYQGISDTVSVNTTAGVNVFGYFGSSANENLAIELTDLSGGIQPNEIYNTNAVLTNSAGFLFIGANDTYVANNAIGIVNVIFKVTTHDTITKTIQGTFFGTVLNTNSSIKQITNGQFKGTYK